MSFYVDVMWVWVAAVLCFCDLVNAKQCVGEAEPAEKGTGRKRKTWSE